MGALVAVGLCFFGVIGVHNFHPSRIRLFSPTAVNRVVIGIPHISKWGQVPIPENVFIFDRSTQMQECLSARYISHSLLAKKCKITFAVLRRWVSDDTTSLFRSDALYVFDAFHRLDYDEQLFHLKTRKTCLNKRGHCTRDSA